MNPLDAGAPLAQRLEGRLDYQRAIDRVIDASRHRLRVFDADLREGGWNDAARYAALRQFLLGSPRCRVEIVLHDVEYVSRGCPRMMNLLRQFSHAMAIHRTNAEARGIYDPIILGDDAHYVHRFHAAQPRAELVLNDLTRTQALSRRFDEIWAASTVAVTATTLGL